MKLPKMIVITAVVGVLLISSAFFLTGCTGQTEAWEPDTVSVCLVQGEGFVAKAHILSIPREADAVFQIRLQENYEILDCSYEDYVITQADNGFTLLTLKNIRYNERVTVTCAIPSSVVLYDPNGGAFADTGSTQPLRISYGPSVHPRQNTLSGDRKLLRQGYVLTGWNTAPDGTGIHIGLGSRVTVPQDTALQLYAQWERETDPELFAWVRVSDGIMLTACRVTDTDTLVIPQQIDGEPVTAIGAGFARDISLEKLVIPDTVLEIEEGAFRNCSVTHMYFFDTLQQVTDASFSESRPRFWHINAVLAPRYLCCSDITAFADKMDLLMLAQGKKLLLFSGCSMNYGLDSRLLADAYPEYTVLNLGAVGGTNAQFQFACILPYVYEGDVFLHAPEQASPYQLMADRNCENRMFIAVEGNYDLLSGVDMTTLGEGAFDSFRAFNAKRRTMEPCAYGDQYLPLNGYGDNAQFRASSGEKQFDEAYGLRPELLTDKALAQLGDWYDRIREAGGRVFLSYAPINALCCGDPAVIEEYSRIWEQAMEARGYETISDLQTCIMDAKYFYDSDYHLTTAGAEQRTRQLILELAPFLGEAQTGP